MQNDRDDPEVQAAMAASLRDLFDSVVRLPTDDPLKRQTRYFLARILEILEKADDPSHRPVSSESLT